MAFQGAGTQPGLQIWRIEDFEAVPYDNSKYGKFHIGDSYIVLKTSGKASRLSWDIHFWLGAETSQDEYGTAAYKAVELDSALGGVPVQHREVQEHESDLFQSYFKNGIKYLPGGVKSGFAHVDPEAVEKRLFIVKGKRNIRVKQVALTPSSMNRSDCFILDLGKDHDILVLMPKGSRRTERFRAVQAANEIRDDDHAGHANVVIIDDLSTGATGEVSRFFTELGSGSYLDLPESAGDDDDVVEKSDAAKVRLFRVSDVSGVAEITTKPLKQELLQQGEPESNDCFILDSGSANGVFVWIGREASNEEKVNAVKAAENFLAKNGLPKWTKVHRVVAGAEPSVFQQYFLSWRDSARPSSLSSAALSTPSSSPAEWDVASLHASSRRRLERVVGAAADFMPDDANGKKQVFRIENMELAEVPSNAHGMFFGGDSYVVKYEYVKNGKPNYIIYFWQGSTSSGDERAASALHALRMDNELDGRAVQIRLTQGHETSHFVRIFKGRMVVFSGGKASGFRNVHDMDSYDADGTRLFRVHGTNADADARAVQVPEKASNLCSDDVFVLETPSKTYIWIGKDSSPAERSVASSVASVVSPGRSVSSVSEGDEPESLWAALGGKADYCDHAHGHAQGDRPALPARLFHCVLTLAGKVRAFEIHDFEQKDLVSDDVMILDSGFEIYVWIGKEASPQEKEKSIDMAKSYLSADPTWRSEANTAIVVVHESNEPDAFARCFPAFN